MSARRLRELREVFDKDFKPTFDEFAEEGGIPLPELKSLLGKSDLPKHEISHLVNTADTDANQRITYDEFLHRALFEDPAKLKRLKIRSRALNRAVIAIAPTEARIHQRKFLSKSGYDEMDTINWGQAEVDNYADAYDCKPPPVFIPLITIAEIAVFTYYAIQHSRDINPNNDVTASSGVPIESILIYNPYIRHQIWRFLTYMFIHNGYIHLIFNCLLQLVLGTLLELVHKFWRVGLVYLLGVITGSLAHSITDPYVLLAGASGGCYALIGAHLATVVMNWKAMQFQWLDNPVNFISSGVFRLLLIIILAGGDTGLAIYGRFTHPDVATSVGFSAHFGGFAAGLIVGIPILRNLEVERWEKVCFWLCIILYFVFIVLAVLFNTFCVTMNKCPPPNWQ